MKITAITRYKQGTIYALIKKLGWSQLELSRRTALHPATVGSIINLIRRPTIEQADKIQKAFGEAGEFLDVLGEWPETFLGLKRGFKVETTEEIPLERLIDCPEVLELAAPDEYDESLFNELDSEMSSHLSERERRVLEGRFVNGEPLDQIANEIGVGSERTRQIERRALLKMRRPVTIARLANHVDPGFFAKDGDISDQYLNGVKWLESKIPADESEDQAPDPTANLEPSIPDKNPDKKLPFIQCPLCLGHELRFLNIRDACFAVCHAQKARWYMGNNWDSGWKKESQEIWERNRDLLKSYSRQE